MKNMIVTYKIMFVCCFNKNKNGQYMVVKLSESSTWNKNEAIKEEVQPKLLWIAVS